MGKSSFGPGFRFKPTDVEIVKYYLKRKLMGKRLHVKVIAELDIYKYDPWDLPDKSCWKSGDLKWYFFCPREKKYRNGNRIQRATECGYWKTTGKDRSVLDCGEVVGWIKTLIFHSGRAPRGDRTDWVMHEYRLEDKGLVDGGVPVDSYVLCMIFQKGGPGPRNGAQYGVPFNEEDWSDDEVEITSEAVQYAIMPEPDIVLPCNYTCPTDTNTNALEDIGIGPSSATFISDIVLPFFKVLQPDSCNDVTMEKPHASDGDDILPMFDYITEENAFYMNESGKGKGEVCSEALPHSHIPEPDFVLPNNYDGSVGTSTPFPVGIGINPFESFISYSPPLPGNVLQLDTGNYATTVNPHVSDGDDILSMFDCFTEESALCMYETGKNEVEGCLEAVLNANMAAPDLLLQNNYNSFIAMSTHSPEVIGAASSYESCRFDVVPPPCKLLQSRSRSYVTMDKPRASNGVDILPMLDCFAEESTFLINENDKTDKNKELNDLIRSCNTDDTPEFNTSNVYEDFGDLGNLARVGEVGYNFCSGPDSMNSFLELGDLDQPMNCDNSMYTRHPSMFGQPSTFREDTPDGFDVDGHVCGQGFGG